MGTWCFGWGIVEVVEGCRLAGVDSLLDGLVEGSWGILAVSVSMRVVRGQAERLMGLGMVVLGLANELVDAATLDPAPVHHAIAAD